MQTSVASRGSSLLGMLRRHLMMRSSSGVACVGFIFLGICLNVSSVRGDVVLDDHFVADPLTHGWSNIVFSGVNWNVTQSGTRVTVSGTATAPASVRVAIRQTTRTVSAAAHDLRTVTQSVTFGGPMTLTDNTPNNGKTGELYFRMILTGQGAGYWKSAASGVVYAEIRQSNSTSSTFSIVYQNKGGATITLFSKPLSISVNDGDRLTATYSNDDVTLWFYDADTTARHLLADKAGYGFEFDIANFPNGGYTVLELACTANVDITDAGSAVWDRIDVTQTSSGVNEYFRDDHFETNPLTNGWSLYNYSSPQGTVTQSGTLATLSETADATTNDIRVAMRQSGSLVDMTSQHLKAVTQKLTFSGPMTFTDNTPDNGQTSYPILFLALTGQNTGYWISSAAGAVYTSIWVRSNGTTTFYVYARSTGDTTAALLATTNLNLIPDTGDELIVRISPDDVTVTIFDASSKNTQAVADHVRHTLAFNTTNFPNGASTVLDFTVSPAPGAGDVGTAVFDRVRVTKDMGFAVNAVLLPLNPGLTQGVNGFASTDIYKDVIDEAARQGYDTIVLGLSDGVGCSFEVLDMGAGSSNPYSSFTKTQLADLIVYARAQRMEPILGVNVLGKTFPNMSGVYGTARTSLSGLATQYPGLFYKETNPATYPQVLQPNQYSNVLNPYYVAGNGHNVFTEILDPMIDELLALYGTTHPARYFVLETDEFHELDVMAYEYAQPAGKTLPQMYGEFLNNMAGYLIGKDVTPIIYGDTLLSTRLQQTGHGVNGFTSDPRFVYESSQYADWVSDSGNSTLTSVNYIDPGVLSGIIVGDWHYRDMPMGQFPSVDYFKQLGFKDVWGLPWWEMQTAQAFADYNAAQNGGGMVETLWNYGDVMPGRKGLSRCLTNAQTYFIDPTYTPPTADLPLTITDQAGQVAAQQYGTTTVFAGSPGTLTVRADVPVDFTPGPAQLAVWPNNYEYAGSSGRAFPSDRVIAPLIHDLGNARLDGQFALPIPASLPAFYDVDLQVHTSDGRYMLGEVRNLDLVFDQQLPSSTGTSSLTTPWLNIDIPTMSNQAAYWGINGPYGGLLYHRRLSLSGGPDYVTYARLPQALWNRIKTDGMTFQTDFRYDGGTNSTYWTVVSHGSYGQGFRVLFNQTTQKVSVQIARTANGASPVWLYSNVVIQPGESASLIFKLSPPGANGIRTASLIVVNQTTSATETPKTAQVALPLVAAPGYPLGIGSEFAMSDPFGTTNILYPQFPGLFTKVTILPYQ